MKTRSARILLATLVLGAVVACSTEKSPDVLDERGEPAAVGRTVQCTVPNADGVRCDVKTCKADARSDCSHFEDGCVRNNHTYTGDKESGTCKRGPLIGSNEGEREVSAEYLGRLHAQASLRRDFRG